MKFTHDDGLPSDRILHITQTDDGTLWANTDRGLAWYDGFVWHAVDDSTQSSQEKIRRIYAVGRYVFAVRDRDFLLQRRHERRIYGRQTLKLPRALAFHEAVPVDTTTFLLLFWDRVNHKEKLYLLRGDSLLSLESPQPMRQSLVFRFHRTFDGAVWLNTDYGLFKWNNGRWDEWIVTPQRHFVAHHLVQNRRGEGLAAMEVFGALKHYWVWKKGERPRLRTAQENSRILSITMDEEGSFFVLFDSGVLQILKGTGKRTIRNLPAEVLDSRVLFCDRDGNLWIGTTWGLFLHRRKDDRWSYVRFDPFDLKNRVHAIDKTPDGVLWLATAGGVVKVFSDGRMEVIDTIDNRPVEDITALCVDTLGQVWIGNGSGSSFYGAYRWDGKRWQHVYIEQGLAVGTVHRIVRDRRGRLWFLSLTGPENNFGFDGVGAFVHDGGRFAQYGPRQGLIHGRVYAFSEGPDGALWFGTLEGLSRYKDGEWTHWSSGGILRGRGYFAVHVDRQNRVWFADRSNGLGCLQDGKVRYYTTRDGLLSNEVWEIQEDAFGRLWLGTAAGVNVFDGETWHEIDQNDGLSNNEVWPIYLEPDRVYIGTKGGGMSILKFENLNRYPAKVVFDLPAVHGKTAFIHFRPYSYFGEQFSHDIQVRHRLDDGPWSPWSLERHLMLSRLSPGEHVLEVQTKGILDTYSSPQRLRFYVEPPLFQRPAFFIPVGFLIWLLAVVLTAYVTRQRTYRRELEASERKFRDLFENANDIIYTHDFQGRFLSVNKAGERAVGYSRDELVGTSIDRLVCPEFVNLAHEMIAAKLRDYQPTTYELEIFSKSGRRIPLEVSTRVIFEDGKPVAIQGIARDISERKLAERQIRKSLEEKVALLKEIHHRVKNNLQIVSSLLSLQLNRIRDLEARQLVRESQDRIRTMAIIHEKLYQSPSLTVIDFRDYMQNLANSMWASYSHLAENVKLRVQAEPVSLSIDQAIPCGLILNELLLNALKHAFRDRSEGEIRLGFFRKNGFCVLEVADNGVGMQTLPQEERRNSLGWHLITILTEQLRGRYSVYTQNGTLVRIEFPGEKEESYDANGH